MKNPESVNSYNNLRKDETEIDSEIFVEMNIVNSVLNDEERKTFSDIKAHTRVQKCFYFVKCLFFNGTIKLVYGLTLTFLWISFYILSLEGCDKGQAECLKSMNQSAAIDIGFRIFYSASLLLTLILFSLMRITHKIFMYFSFLAMVYFFYFYDTGSDFKSHGSYNRVFFYLCLFVEIVIISILYLIGILLKKFPIRTIIIVPLLIILIYYKITSIIHNSCEYWNKGFKNSFIDNHIGICKIYTPPTCFLKITDNFFDVSRWKGVDCSSRNPINERKLLLEHIPQSLNLHNTKRIGFPRTEKWNFFPDSNYLIYDKNIFKNMVDMDDPDKSKTEDIEVYINYNSYYPEVVIDLKKNQTLIEERSKLLNQHINSTIFKNVILIYFDALSRNHFRRKLQNTFKWLEEYYEDENSPESDKEYTSYQFLKYHSLTYYTYGNMIPGYFGMYNAEEYNMKYFLYEYKSRGYITGQSSNVCEREGWDLEPYFEKYLNYTNYDHEMNGFYCDPNFADPDDAYHIFKGAYSITRKCMYGKDAGAHQIEYAKQFFEKYKDQNKFFRMMFSDAHEGTLESVKYLDEYVVDYLEFLKSKGHLENSVILLMSDHGSSMPGPAYLLHPKDWFREVFLGSLFLVIPKNHHKYEIINKYTKLNENLMVTSFDIYSTLLNFVDKDINKTRYGSSLIDDSVNESYRSCIFYKMESYYCICGL